MRKINKLPAVTALCLTATMSLASCASVSKMSIQADVESELLYRNRQEIAAIMRSDPKDSVTLQGGVVLVYDARQYAGERYGNGTLSGRDRDINAYINREGYCYAVRTNAVIKKRSYDPDKTHEGTKGFFTGFRDMVVETIFNIALAITRI